MQEINHNCQPCHPFTKGKCYLCLKSKLEALSLAKALKRANPDLDGLEKRDDLFSLIPEDELMEDGFLLAVNQ